MSVGAVLPTKASRTSSRGRKRICRALWQECRHVLRRMHGKIETSVGELFFQFRREEALAADGCQRPILNPVACVESATISNISSAGHALHQSSAGFMSLSERKRLPRFRFGKVLFASDFIRCYRRPRKRVSRPPQLRSVPWFPFFASSASKPAVTRRQRPSSCVMTTGAARLLLTSCSPARRAQRLWRCRAGDCRPCACRGARYVMRRHWRAPARLSRHRCRCRNRRSRPHRWPDRRSHDRQGDCKGLSKPLYAINHLEGHALTARLTDDFPFLPEASGVGRHTQLVLVRGVGQYERWARRSTTHWAKP